MSWTRTGKSGKASRFGAVPKKPQALPIPPPPPRAKGLDIGAFSRVFGMTTNSYKFLWMLGLLDVLGEKEFKIGQVSARRVVAHMLKHAEDPLRRFHLSLGAQDQMSRHVGESLGALTAAAGIAQIVRGEKVLDSVYDELSFFVPQRFLTPFFQAELARRKDHDKDGIIHTLAGERFSRPPLPLYRLSGGRLEDGGKPLVLIFHKRWLRYLKENAGIVRGWALWHWADYLESRNPNVPGIIAKIARPESRKALVKQREFWRETVGKLGDIRCIYSGEKLRGESDYDLDHFIPWSFAGHNNLWNLVPALKEANARKSDILPADKYFHKFVDAQRRALTVYRKHFPGKWANLMDAYEADLKVNPHLPWTQKALVEKFGLVVPPLLSLAESMGFESGWDYNARPPNQLVE